MNELNLRKLNSFRMASATILKQQWTELEPKTGFSFENYERNQKIIKDKVSFLDWAPIRLGYLLFHSHVLKIEFWHT